MTRSTRAAIALAHPALAGSIAVAILALLASASGMVNGFVYDDLPIIANNSRVHTLAQWWDAFGRAYWPPHWGNTHYRPVTILSFAVQWAIGGGSTVVFHATSIALYVATSVALFALARLVLPLGAAWIVAALFAVHPVHVEAVANVVGQSELLVALCSILATICYLRARFSDRGLDRRAVATIALLYGIACFAKEAGFLLPALLVAAELTIVVPRLPLMRLALRARARQLWSVYAVCGAIAVVYLLARHSVLGAIGDPPNVLVWRLSQGQLGLTMLGVVREWARLLLWPAELAADYSPPRIPLVLAPTLDVLPGAVILLGLVALTFAAWRVRSATVLFGIAWFAVTIFPVSNLFVRSGVLLAERTLFVPSVGAMLALGPLLAWLGARISTLRQRSLLAPAGATIAVVAILSLGVMKSASRSRVWRDIDSFYGQIAADAPLSYRAHHAHGTWLFTKGRRVEAERHLRIAIAMFPYDAGPMTDLADHYRQAGLCEPARDLYRRAIELGMLRDRARMGLVICLLRDGHYADAAGQARLGVSGGGFQLAQFQRLMEVADSAAAASSGPRQTGTPRPPTAR